MKIFKSLPLSLLKASVKSFRPIKPLQSFCSLVPKNQPLDFDMQMEIENYQQTQVMIDPQDTQNSFLYDTKFGLAKLVNLNYPKPFLQKVKGIYYVNNSISANYLKKILKEDKNAFIVFEPSSNYQNVQMVYESVKRLIRENYFGSPKKVKNPFRNCSNQLEIYHLHKRIQAEQKNMLNRILLLVNYGNYSNGNLLKIIFSFSIFNFLDGSIRVKSFTQQSKLLVTLMGQFYQIPDQPYAKHDFLISYKNLQGILSSEEYSKKGISIPLLNDKKIYPNYSVWTPTSQNYLKLIQDFIVKNQKKLKMYKSILDLGCGTGIFGFLFSQTQSLVFAIDINEKAVQCAQLNAELLDIQFRAEKLNYFTEKLPQEWPEKYDLILCNPPWISSKKEQKSLDLGVYDYENQGIQGSFLMAKKHLSPKGTFLLMYSNLGSNIGTNVQEQVQLYCEEYQMKIRNTLERPFLDFGEASSEDPLRQVKQQSMIQLYEIEKQLM